MQLEEVINQCTIENNVVFLPNVQLERKVYLEVNKKLQGIGGKWNRKNKGFVFQSDPSTLLGRVKDGENINLKKDYQFFETPSEIAQTLIGLAQPEIGETVLEPSAGRGAIINELARGIHIDCYELMPENYDHLKEKFADRLNQNVELLGYDFLKADECKKYSCIIANPPFSKNQDIKHVTKMYRMLEDGGRLVSVMSSHFTFSEDKASKQFRSLLEDNQPYQVISLESGAFKSSGTMVNSVIVKIVKPTPSKEG